MSASEAGRPAIEPTRGQAKPASDSVRLTLFALPKPYVEEQTVQIQLNALRSWLALGADVEVLLLGDEEGIAATAALEGARHLPGVARNTRGTPLIDSAFALANQAARGEYLMYCNADVVLRGALPQLAERLGQRWPAGFLAFGRRRDVKIEKLLNWEDREGTRRQLDDSRQRGRLAARVCKEYFLFRRGQFRQLPAFAVGRGNWDNWMVANARRSGLAVIDASETVEALHQEHGYAHLSHERGTGKSRWECYVAGPEARENERLAGGKWVVSGSSADWQINRQGEITPKRLSRWHSDFWLDLPRFLRLSCQLPFQR